MRREMPRFHVRVLRMQLPEILLPYRVLIAPHCHPSDLSYYYVVLLFIVRTLQIQSVEQYPMASAQRAPDSAACFSAACTRLSKSNDRRLHR